MQLFLLVPYLKSMKTRFYFPIIILLIGLATHLSFAQEQVKPQDFSGIWQQRGYGRVSHITGTELIIYENTHETCVLAEKAPVAYLEQFGDLAIEGEDLLTLKVGINTYYFDRLEQLPDLCQSIDPNLAKDPMYNFDVLWNTFKDHYVYFDQRNIDWDAYREKYLPQVQAVSDEVGLYKLFNSMLESLGDGHVGLLAPDKIEKRAAKREPKTNLSKLRSGTRRAILERYIPDMREYHKGLLRWGSINDELGYIQLNAMMRFADYGIPEEWKSQKFWKAYLKKASVDPRPMKHEVEDTRKIIETVMGDLREKKALIIDIRFNGGGFDEVGLEILSQFTDKRRYAFAKKARDGEDFLPSQEVYLTPIPNPFVGKVYLLTSGETASAAEIMTLSSMVLPQFTRVGSATEGVFSDVLDKTLPNGWEFGLSNEVYHSAEGKDYENQGIPADKVFPYPRDTQKFYESLQSIEAEGDPAIEWVIGEMKN